MSTEFRPMRYLTYQEIKNKCPNIEFVKNEHASNMWGESLVMNGNYLHFYDDTKFIIGFTRYGRNNVEDIINEIQFNTGVLIFDEHSSQYEALFFQDLDEEEREEWLKEVDSERINS